MSKFLKTTILLMSALAFFANPAVAGGHKSAQMDRAGFDCFNDGPSNFMHCLRFEHFGNPAVPVKVFSPDGMEFLGTELLLRPDIYNGQPCSQDSGDFWDYNEVVDYFACHHFHTGHH